MEEFLDMKDRRILTLLDADARLSEAEIAKRTRVSKQVVNYRIRRLQEKGIIENFYTIVNVGRLGLDTYYIFLQLQKANQLAESRLLDQLGQLPYVGWLASGTGRWDAVLIVYANSHGMFDILFNEVMRICGDHLHESSFAAMIHSEHISYWFLKEGSAKRVPQTEKEPHCALDEQDRAILAAISQNARAQAVELARSSGLPVHVVRYRLKELVRKGIIGGFKPKVDVGRLGYQWHLVMIQFQHCPEERKREFSAFCKSHRKIYYVANTIGLYNIMFDVHVRSTLEFKEFLLEIKEHFPDVIRLYESMIAFEEHKIDYFPASLL